jgi:hypothetical protein
MICPLPNKKELEKIYDWNENGSLKYKIQTTNSVKIGQEVGSMDNQGYYRLSFNSQRYLKHRILYVLYYDICIDDLKIDHIDGNTTNNSKSNLRIDPNYKNSWNRKKPCNNKSGCKGVIWDVQRKKWQPYIRVNKKNYKLGRFDNFIYACLVRKRAEKKYHAEWKRNGNEEI